MDSLNTKHILIPIPTWRPVICISILILGCCAQRCARPGIKHEAERLKSPKQYLQDESSVVSVAHLFPL